MNIKNLLISSNNIPKSTFFWNAFAAVMNSFQTMVLLIIITNFGNVEDSSNFVMAYAVGNLALYIGKYGVRQYQVTDIMEKYSFTDYLIARRCSVFGMIIFVGIYLFISWAGGYYSTRKIYVVFLICLLKGLEAFEDVYHARMQQLKRLDVASKILGIRLLIFIIVFSFLYLITRNLSFTVTIAVLLNYILAIYLNNSVLDEFDIEIDNDNISKYKEILKNCFPLFVSTCISMYVANAPKYIVDTVLTDLEQTNLNIIIMPTFVMALLGNFIFQPIMRTLGEKWENREIYSLIRKMKRIVLLIFAMTIIISTICYYYGVEILGILYGLDLGKYKIELIMFIISGGCIALQNFANILLTIMRKQEWLLLGYLVCFLVFLLFGRRILLSHGELVMSVFYLLVMFSLLFFCTILIVIYLHKKYRQEN